MTAPLRILADENIPGLKAAFSDDVVLRLMPGRDINKHDVLDSDVLLVRSVTPVNADLLDGSPIKFVATATIGLDHIDLDYLKSSNIGFVYAPGSNAQSVVEYVLVAMAYWLQHNQRAFKDVTVGIVGVGRIGGLLHRYLKQMGVSCLLCDPPRQAQQPELPFYSLAEISQADIISFHVPLTDIGAWPTRHMITPAFLSTLNANQLLINSARGAVLDNQMALKYMQHSNNTVNLILDVWEHEPDINAALLRQCLLATPHIAGYAIEGKWRATAMLCRALGDYFNVPVSSGYLDKLTHIEQPWLPHKDEDLVSSFLSRYAIKEDDMALRNAVKKLPKSFDYLRKNYPARHEFLAPINHVVN